MGQSSETSAEPSGGGSRTALAFAALVAVGAGAYANSFHAPFVLDDWNNITDNPFVRWTSLDLESVRFTIANAPLLRPVAYLTFALNHWFGGYEVAGYHAVNLAIHVANACWVYAFALLTLRRLPTLSQQRSPAPSQASAPWLALAAALVFVAHPIQTQSVTYVVQRMNLLCAFFYLAALYAFVRGRLAAPGARAVGCFALSALSFALALGSKENAATLPVAAWLYDWYFLRDLRRERRSELAIATVAICFAAGFFARGGTALLDYSSRSFTLGERLLTQPRVVLLYLSLIALPLPGRLNLAHDVPVSHGLLDPPTTLASLVALAALVALAVVLARRHRLASFAIAWFLLQLVIESSIFPLELVFEHRTYLPLVGLCLWLPLPLAALAARRPALATAATAALVGALALGTFVRNETWSSELDLWADAVAKSPNLIRAHTNLGVALEHAGRHEEALASYDRALALDPDSAELHYDRVFSLRALGREDEAEAELDRVLALEPQHAGANHLKGEAALRRGDLGTAIAHLEQALSVNPRVAASHHLLGIAYLARGELERAAPSLQAAARLDPRLAPSARRAFAVASASRGLARLAQGDGTGALLDLRAALAADPDDAIAANGLAWILATSSQPALRNPEEAVRAAELAVRTRPEDPGLLDTLGAAYASDGRFAEAIETSQRAENLASAQGDHALRDRIRERVERYRAGESWVASP
jgi:tetratricopeptide (TPR) repeat protein